MNGLARFVQYNNAVPIALGILVLGGASAFAATQPEAIYSSEQKVISVDNTYIANKDLSSYTPQVQITGVTEDADTYFVSYTFKTIDVRDSVWQDVEKTNTMSVAKSVLGQYGDLGVYVAEQFGQNIDHEVDRLKEVQIAERKNVTQKTVATAYGGLVGKLLDDKTEVFAGYTPVVTEPVPPIPEQTASVSNSEDAGAENTVAQTAPPTPAQATTQGSLTREEVEQLIRERVAELLADSTGSTGSQQANSPRSEENMSASPPQPAEGASAPIISINGNNPAHLAVGDTFGDLGATITGPTDADKNLGIYTYLDGVAMETIQLDTSVAGEHTIDYVTTNSFGTATSTRTVIIEAPADSTPIPSSDGGATGQAATSTEQVATDSATSTVTSI